MSLVQDHVLAVALGVLLLIAGLWWITRATPSDQDEHDALQQRDGHPPRRG